MKQTLQIFSHILIFPSCQSLRTKRAALSVIIKKGYQFKSEGEFEQYLKDKEIA